MADLAPKAPDVVKVVYDRRTYTGPSMPTVDLATLTALIESAQAHGFKTVVHIGTWDDVRDAVQAGADAVTHTPAPDPVPPDVVALMAESGAYHIPTLAVQGDLARFVDDPTLLENALLAEMAPEDFLAGYGSDQWPDMAGAWLDWQRGQMSSLGDAIRALADAGVPMLTGTDGGNMGVFQGHAVVRAGEVVDRDALRTW